MLFLVDAQLPPALADTLRRDGSDAIHTADICMLTETDSNIWHEAVNRSAVLVTKDRDFARIRAARQRGPIILWIRLGNMDNRNLIDRISRATPKVITSIQRGDTVIELTK